MTRPADRLLRTVDAARTKTTLKTLAPGGNLGQTGRARVVRPGTVAGATPTVAFDVVIHGADGTVTRPAAKTVMWVGAATPANGLDFDLWYPVTL